MHERVGRRYLDAVEDAPPVRGAERLRVAVVEEAVALVGGGRQLERVRAARRLIVGDGGVPLPRPARGRGVADGCPRILRTAGNDPPCTASHRRGRRSHPRRHRRSRRRPRPATRAAARRAAGTTAAARAAAAAATAPRVAARTAPAGTARRATAAPATGGAAAAGRRTARGPRRAAPGRATTTATGHAAAAGRAAAGRAAPPARFAASTAGPPTPAPPEPAVPLLEGLSDSAQPEPTSSAPSATSAVQEPRVLGVTPVRTARPPKRSSARYRLMNLLQADELDVVDAQLDGAGAARR